MTTILTPYLRRHWLDIAWLAALILYVLAGVPFTPFHGDEATQIYMSRDYAYQFIQRDLSRVYFDTNPISPTEQHLRLLNGTVNKYAIGLAWHLGGFQLGDVNDQWDWGADWNYNHQYGHAPSDSLLLAARWPSALFTAAGVIVIFGIGWLLGGRPEALAASLLFALNPVILLNGRRAMMEGSLLMFSLLVLLAGIWVMRRRAWWAFGLLGLAGGLAVASKHTGIFTVGAVFLACSTHAVWRLARSRRWRDMFGYAAALSGAGMLAVLVFYVLNPAWWGDPFTRAGLVLDLRTELLSEQVAVFGGYTDFGAQVKGLFDQFITIQPQYFEVSGWATTIGDQIARYAASPWAGVSISGPVSVIWLGLLLIGVLRLSLDGRMKPESRGLIAVWTLVVLLATLLLTPLEWQRYYVPAYPVLVILAALGLAVFVRAGYQHLVKPRLEK